MTPKNEALQLLEDALKTLESPKGSVLSSVQKLLRASDLIGNQDIQIWCAIQLGEQKYTKPLQKLVAAMVVRDGSQPTKKQKENISAALKELKELNLKEHVHYCREELNVKKPSVKKI
jgi:hypothetical protein